MDYLEFMVTDRIMISGDEAEEVIQNSDQAEQIFDAPTLIELLDIVQWDDLQAMRAIAAVPSMRKVAVELGVSINTLRTRLQRLEHSIGTTLFFRDWEGIKITAEGRAVLSVANEMRHMRVNLPLGKGNNILARDGEIRICATEGIGTFWLTPRLIELKSLLPKLIVSLHCFSDQDAVNLKDFDICLGYSKPSNQDSIVSKLASIHVMPFASEQYLRAQGRPSSLDELVGHHCVQQDSPGTNYDAIRLFFGEAMLRDFVRIQVNSSYSLFWAVASGVGIGALPTYIRSVSHRVRPIDLPIQLKFELWASYGHAARQSEPVRTAMQWLRESFDSKRYPWFGDQFVHPNDFAGPFEDSQVIPIFDHLIDAPD
jgi:DNA-binding transcriptional LysR family regulator